MTMNEVLTVSSDYSASTTHMLAINKDNSIVLEVSASDSNNAHAILINEILMLVIFAYLHQ